jgi:hypothetical protein
MLKEPKPLTKEEIENLPEGTITITDEIGDVYLASQRSIDAYNKYLENPEGQMTMEGVFKWLDEVQDE